MTTIPSYIAAGAFQSSASAITVPVPAGYVANDFLLLLISTPNEVITTPSGWTQTPNSPQFTGTAATALGVRLGTFYKIATASESSIAVADAGTLNTGQMFCFRGVDVSNPIHISAGNVQATGLAALAFSGVTTTIPNCLIVNCLGNDRDLTGTTNLSGWANASLASPSITEYGDATSATGTGGGIGLAIGGKAAAGVVNGTTVTNGAAVAAAMITLALAPTPDAVALNGASTVTLSGISEATVGTVLADGNSAEVLDNVTFVMTGTVTDPPDVGTSTSTLENITRSAVGTALSTGTHAKTLGTLTQSGVGNVSNAGVSSRTLDNITRSQSGTAQASGIASKSLDNVTSTSSGYVQFTGVSTKVLDNIGSVVSGNAPATGISTKTLDNITRNAVGNIPIVGSSASTLQTVTPAQVGIIPDAGLAAKVLDGITRTAVGSVTSTGISSKTLGNVTPVASGNLPVVGGESKTLADVGVSQVGAITDVSVFYGTSSVTLDSCNTIGVGKTRITGTSSTVVGLTSVATGKAGSLGASTQTLESVSSQAIGTVDVKAVMTKALANTTNEGTGTVADPFIGPINGSSSVVLSLGSIATGQVLVDGDSIVMLQGVTSTAIGKVKDKVEVHDSGWQETTTIEYVKSLVEVDRVPSSRTVELSHDYHRIDTEVQTLTYNAELVEMQIQVDVDIEED